MNILYRYLHAAVFSIFLVACNSGRLTDNGRDIINSRVERESSKLDKIEISDIDKWIGNFQTLPYGKENKPLPMGEYCFDAECFHFVWRLNETKDNGAARVWVDHVNDFDSPEATCYSFSKRLIPEREGSDPHATRMIFPDTTFIFVRRDKQWDFVKYCVVNNRSGYDSVRFRAIRGLL